jgi:hypothetical protein
MNTKTQVRTIKSLQQVAVVLAIGALAILGGRLGHHYSGGGSLVTNPSGFASAQMASGIRLVER